MADIPQDIVGVISPKRRTYRASVDQVARARRFTARAVGAHPSCGDAVLLVSELATNVIRHSGARQFTVSVWETPDKAVQVTVADNGSAETTPHLCTPHPDNVSGRGMHLVDQLANRWGITRQRTAGVAVWFVLDGPRTAPRRSSRLHLANLLARRRRMKKQALTSTQILHSLGETVAVGSAAPLPQRDGR